MTTVGACLFVFFFFFSQKTDPGPYFSLRLLECSRPHQFLPPHHFLLLAEQAFVIPTTPPTMLHGMASIRVLAFTSWDTHACPSSANFFPINQGFSGPLPTSGCCPSHMPPPRPRNPKLKPAALGPPPPGSGNHFKPSPPLDFIPPPRDVVSAAGQTRVLDATMLLPSLTCGLPLFKPLLPRRGDPFLLPPLVFFFFLLRQCRIAGNNSMVPPSFFLFLSGPGSPPVFGPPPAPYLFGVFD